MSFSKCLIFILTLAVSAHMGFAEDKPKKDPKILYPKHSDVDLDAVKIEGEIRNPGEFYFQHRKEEKFDSLVKRRKNFHQEMLRDAVLSP